MAYTDTVGTIARVTFAFTNVLPQIQETNLSYTVASATGPPQDSRAQLGILLSAYMGGFHINIANTAQNYYGYKVSIVNQPPPPGAIELVINTPGSLTGGVVPTQVRPLLSWHTAIGGRKYRGRNFLQTPDFSLVKQTTNGPTASLLAAMATLGGQLATPVVLTSGASVTTWLLSIAHRTKGPPVSWSSTPVVGFVTQNVFATQWKSGGTGRPNVLPW